PQQATVGPFPARSLRAHKNVLTGLQWQGEALTLPPQQGTVEGLCSERVRGPQVGPAEGVGFVDRGKTGEVPGCADTEPTALRVDEVGHPSVFSDVARFHQDAAAAAFCVLDRSVHVRAGDEEGPRGSLLFTVQRADRTPPP